MKKDFYYALVQDINTYSNEPTVEDDLFFENLTDEFEDVARCCLRKYKIEFYENSPF